MQPSVIEKLLQWELAGGAVRIARLSQTEAEFELCSCTGEPMERLSCSDPTVLKIGNRLLSGTTSLSTSARVGGFGTCSVPVPVPVIILSAQGREADKVNALDLGADDYLTKPFGVEELLARVRAALRRADVSLTPKESEVLAYLARNAGKVLTQRQILHTVWGAEYDDEAEHVWTYIRRIRRKIEPDPQHPRYLLTEPGVGYRVVNPD